MTTILEKLYHGELYPEEQHIPKIVAHRLLKEKHYQHYEGFIAKLDEPLKGEFIQIMDEHLDTIPFEVKEMFLDGLRLGARMILELLDEEKAPT